MDIMSAIERKPNPNIPDITSGDTVKVNTRIVEGGKERIQVFNGLVIRIRHGGGGGTFTVRHIAYGIGVERTFPFSSPMVESVELVRHGKVRRAKLYYLRGLSGKAARIKERRLEQKELGGEVAAEPQAEATPPTEAATEQASAEVGKPPAEAQVQEQPQATEPGKGQGTPAA